MLTFCSPEAYNVIVTGLTIFNNGVPVSVSFIKGISLVTLLFDRSMRDTV